MPRMIFNLILILLYKMIFSCGIQLYIHTYVHTYIYIIRNKLCDFTLYTAYISVTPDTYFWNICMYILFVAHFQIIPLENQMMLKYFPWTTLKRSFRPIPGYCSSLLGMIPRFQEINIYNLSITGSNTHVSRTESNVYILAYLLCV